MIRLTLAHCHCHAKESVIFLWTRMLNQFWLQYGQTLSEFFNCAPGTLVHDVRTRCGQLTLTMPCRSQFIPFASLLMTVISGHLFFDCHFYTCWYSKTMDEQKYCHLHKVGSINCLPDVNHVHTVFLCINEGLIFITAQVLIFVIMCLMLQH